MKKSIRRSFLFLGALALSTPLVVVPVLWSQEVQHSAPDNSRENKDQTNPTADQQKENAADRATTQKIRKAIHDDASLSTYAHNAKVITQDGRVTLRGPVLSEDEKSNLGEKAAVAVGRDNVTNQLEVSHSK
jgi:hyperosmotically inducible protein